jgi:hypothetical protein
MLIVPLAPLPSQTVTVPLGGQDCRIDVYAKTTGVFLDLYVSGVLIVGGAICRDRVRIVRDAYLGFAGDLGFYDTQGRDDPSSAGIGGRFLLAYIEPGDPA